MSSNLSGQTDSAVKLSAVQKIESIRSGELARHEAQVASICELLCKSVGLDDHFVGPMRLAAQLHDLGKLTISDELLNKPTPLTDNEMMVMRNHSMAGYDIMFGSGDPVLDFAAGIARAHHEAFDGSGYPRGLKGEAIPLGSRIVSLCDVYDALRTDRPYRAGLSHEKAVTVINAPQGRASRENFDPGLLRAFMNNAASLAQIYG